MPGQGKTRPISRQHGPIAGPMAGPMARPVPVLAMARPAVVPKLKTQYHIDHTIIPRYQRLEREGVGQAAPHEIGDVARHPRPKEPAVDAGH